MSDWNKIIEEGRGHLIQSRIELMEKTLVLHYNQIKEIHSLLMDFIVNTEESLEELMDRVIKLEQGISVEEKND